MKISGQVEVYKIMPSGKKELVHLEENLLVDGAGKHIVTMQTKNKTGKLRLQVEAVIITVIIYPASWAPQ